ncbi:uncharacterized protein B0H18DRAFT_1000398 [Fomitopsis serialis]|uniref:uncharacterized protein n=1 Tax=Fomitopsis serialis TaxID=139415 RepID=UPI0020081D7D|nr:uncharacterized protein B0H18DRAFT_1000398 [Neoantrodia serialis]KAH9928737.1 hypothetical protein B0H18DRAFT_1000398 [Neoantrodia serialis]
MAPGLLEKLKTKKSKEVISAKAAVPAPAVESPKADSKRRKRKSQAGADDTPSTSTSVQPATTTEAAPKKSKKADALPIEPAQVPPVAEKAPAKKGKGEQEELADEQVSSGAASLKGKRKEKGAGAVDKGSVAGEKKGKGKEARLEVEADTEVEKRAKSKKGRKSKKEGSLWRTTSPKRRAPSRKRARKSQRRLLRKRSNRSRRRRHPKSRWDGIDVTKLPTIAKDDAVVKKRLDQAKKHPTVDRGVIYLGRIPHGFYEDQMRQYLSQFGTTGRSKHYAFIEFDSSSVAEIIIPKDEVHSELWIGANKKWRVIPRDRIARVQHNKRLLKRQAQRKRKLEEAGINYDFGAVAYVCLRLSALNHSLSTFFGLPRKSPSL